MPRKGTTPRVAEGLPSSLDDQEKDALAVAWLTQQRVTQTEIKEFLQLRNQTEVSRLRKLAEAKNWLTWNVDWPENADQAEIEKKAFRDLDELKAKLNKVAARMPGGVTIETIRVVFCGDSDDRESRFGEQAGRALVPLIQTARTCAVAWGRTIHATLQGIASQRAPRDDLEFLPISGEPFNYQETTISPSEAAALLSARFGCSGKTRSLQGVGARIPRAEGAEAVDIATIRRFYASCEDYREIFGGDDPLIDRVDMILTGIGDVATSTKDPWFSETVQMEGIDASEFARITGGNIGGVWLPADDATAAKVQEINERWLGIQKRHYVACARRAERERGKIPGVVVLAIEEEKSSIVLRAAGMFNRLICSRALAERLLKEVDTML
jgi:DNA-binding transcriptional regulator LsrR (DeoR family)